MPYKKGIETENKIVEEAKRVFYEKGYNAASVTEICSNIGIMPGNASYYFKKKRDLAGRVLLDFMEEILEYIEKNYEDKNRIFVYSLACNIISLVQFSDEKRMRFVREYLGKGYFIQLNSSYAGTFTPIFNEESSQIFTKEQMRITMLANNSVYVSLILDLLRRTEGHPDKDETLKICWVINGIIGRVFNEDEDEKYIESKKAIDEAKELDISQFTFLK